ncbi:MAG: hypothetical protein ACE5GC_09530 [Acidimicrobiia bacterium]
MLEDPLAAACVVLSTFACSGGDDSGEDSTIGPPPADATISTNEWRSGPAALSFPAGTQVTIDLRNDGRILHEWTLLQERIDTGQDYRDELVIATRSVPAGAIETISFTVPAAGVYQFIGPIPGHFSQGMSGALTATP